MFFSHVFLFDSNRPFTTYLGASKSVPELHKIRRSLDFKVLSLGKRRSGGAPFDGILIFKARFAQIY